MPTTSCTPASTKNTRGDKPALSRRQQELLLQCGRPLCCLLGFNGFNEATAKERSPVGLNQAAFLTEARQLVVSVQIDEQGLRTARRMKVLGMFQEMHATVDLFGAEHAHLRLSRSGAKLLFRMLKDEHNSHRARQKQLPFGAPISPPLL